MFTSTANVDDYREYEWRLADANKDVNDALSYTSSSGVFVGYRKFAIRIDMISSSINVAPTVRDIRAIAIT